MGFVGNALIRGVVWGAGAFGIDKAAQKLKKKYF